ncbi:sensor domain-containing diguanylate cyclase [bacterium]|nr:sensor domain-containing diguanylate cyclase [candidate division CSSED10-310 bacterium]
MDDYITVLTDVDDWQEDCRSILNDLQYENEVLTTDYYPARIPNQTTTLLAVLPRPDHPLVLRTEPFRDKYPTVPIIVFFPPEELGFDQWNLVRRLDCVAALPLEPLKIRDVIETVRRHGKLDRKKTEAAARLEILEASYQAFVTVGRFMASSLRVDEVLTGILQAAGSLLHAEAWSVALRDMDTGDLVFRAAQGGAADQIIGIRVPHGKGIVGWVCENGEPLIVPDTSKDHRHFKAVDDNSGFISQSILCMPLKTHEKKIGAIEFINKVDSQFSPGDMERVQVILDLAAVALDNAMMFEKLHAIVEQDELSGLYNQHSLIRRLEKLIEESGKTRSTFGYIFLDLDYLKLVNDKYGHLRGRAVLQEVGKLLKAILKETAIIGRYGGDEFWVILPGADKVTTMMIAETIRSAIEAQIFLKDQGLNIHLTASLGVVVFPQHADTFDRMAQLADEALYMAKKQNRNKVICALDTIRPGTM